MTKPENTLNRRQTIRLLAAAPLMATALSACGKKTEPDRCDNLAGLSDGEKTAWVLVIALLHFLGAVIYFFAGRPKAHTPLLTTAHATT